MHERDIAVLDYPCTSRDIDRGITQMHTRVIGHDALEVSKAQRVESGITTDVHAA